MTEIETTLRQMIAQIVDERIGSSVARGDAMARLHGEYVKIGGGYGTESKRLCGGNTDSCAQVR